MRGLATFGAGLAEGLIGGAEAAEASKERQRQWELEQAKLRLMELEAQQQDAYRMGSLGIQGQELGVRREGLGLDRERNALLMRQLELPSTPFDGMGPIPLRIGDRAYDVPATPRAMEAFGPYLREEAERGHREAHPELYPTPSGRTPSVQGIITDKDRANMRISLLKDIYGSPAFTERPGDRKAFFDAAWRSAQEVEPDIFGEPPPDPTQQFLEQAKAEGFTSKEEANAAISQFMKEHPDLAEEIDWGVVETWVGSLPKAPKPKYPRKQTERESTSRLRQQFVR